MDSSVDRVPDYLAPIAGARSWRLAPSIWARMGGYLWSAAMLHHWTDGEEEVARCDAGHRAPALGCRCGVYAWETAQLLLRSGYAVHDHRNISGVVAGAGLVRRDGGGYWVSERVVVMAFFDDGYPSPKIHVQDDVYLPTKQDAAEAYGVPMIQYSDYEDFCEEYGLIVHRGR